MPEGMGVKGACVVGKVSSAAPELNFGTTTKTVGLECRRGNRNS